MNWNITEAKQHFSDVIKQAASEPQIIYKRNTPVAVMIAAEELAEFRLWKEGRQQQSLGDAFAELRQLAAGDPDPLPDMIRATRNACNPFCL